MTSDGSDHAWYARRSLRASLRHARSSATPRAPPPGASARARSHFGRRPLVMGIVNVTPDSFSDGGQLLRRRRPRSITPCSSPPTAPTSSTSAAKAPGPTPTPSTPTKNCAACCRSSSGLAGRTDVPISIDTSKALVAAGGVGRRRRDHQRRHRPDRRPDDAAAGVAPQAPACAPCTCRARRRRCRTIRSTTTSSPRSWRFSASDATLLVAAGHRAGPDLPRPRHRVWQDAPAQSHADGATAAGSTSWAAPCWQARRARGFSRKVLGDKDADRAAATAGAALAAAVQGVQIVRVHDVRPVRDALLAFEACGGIDGVELEASVDALRRRCAEPNARLRRHRRPAMTRAVVRVDPTFALNDTYAYGHRRPHRRRARRRYPRSGRLLPGCGPPRQVGRRRKWRRCPRR